MPDLQFKIEAAEPAPDAASPVIVFKLRITETSGATLQSIALRVQAQIEPIRRRYTASEQARLKEMFGEPERWSQSLRPLLWANANVAVPGFVATTVIEVSVPCTFDFNVAVTKYIYGLENGELPTTLLFSGTVFYAGEFGVQIAQIPWDREATWRLPVTAWKQMMDTHYPNTAWVCLRRDIFEQVNEFRTQNGLPTWEQAVERLLESAKTQAPRTTSPAEGGRGYTCAEVKS